MAIISIYPKDTPTECFFCGKTLVNYDRKQDYVVKMYRVVSVYNGVQRYLEFNVHVPSCRGCRKETNVALWFIILIVLSVLIGSFWAFFEHGTGLGFWCGLMYFFVGGIIGGCIGALLSAFFMIIPQGLNENFDKKYRSNKKAYPPIALLEKYGADFTLEKAKLKAGEKCGTSGIGTDWQSLQQNFSLDLHMLSLQGFTIENES